MKTFQVTAISAETGVEHTESALTRNLMLCAFPLQDCATNVHQCRHLRSYMVSLGKVSFLVWLPLKACLRI